MKILAIYDNDDEYNFPLIPVDKVKDADEARDYFNDETFLIELDNGHVLVRNF